MMNRYEILAQGNAAYLQKEEQVLLALRSLLYEGNWEEMVQDLLGRKGAKPVIKKLDDRIEEDLARIANFRTLEAQGITYGYDPHTGVYICVRNP